MLQQERVQKIAFRTQKELDMMDLKETQTGDVLFVPPEDGLELLLVLSNTQGTCNSRKITFLSLMYGARYAIMLYAGRETKSWSIIGRVDA